MYNSEREPLLDKRAEESGNGPEQLIGSPKEQYDSVLARFQRNRFLSTLRRTQVPKTFLLLLLSVITVVCLSAVTISLPLATSAVRAGGGDGYTMAATCYVLTFPILFSVFLVHKLFFNYRFELFPRRGWVTIILTGLCLGVMVTFLVMSGHPSRTPAYLQALLIGLMIPTVVVSRRILIKKGINRKQILCIIVLFVGFFISLVPSMFLEKDTDADPTQRKWYFSVMNGAGWIPSGIAYVLMEKHHEETKRSTMEIQAWTMLVGVLTCVGLFWLNLIPGLGLATGPGEMLKHLQTTARCMYLGDPACSNVPYLSLLIFGSFAFGWLFSILLLELEGGAIYSALVQALIIPIGSLFWTFFTPEPYFHWNPTFSSTTICVIVGLLLMCPAIAVYTHSSEGERTGNEGNSVTPT